MLLGATAFGCFSVLWTSVAFLLSGAPYHYGNAVIGLFGLAGLAGALAAPVAGRLSDRGRGRVAMSGAIVVLLLSWGLLAFGKTSVVALIAGIVVLDLGAQAMHISNQSAVYSLHGQARSRLTTAYMVAYFSGGVALSAATSALYSSGGWEAVCALGAGTAARRADHLAGDRAHDDGAPADRRRQRGVRGQHRSMRPRLVATDLDGTLLQGGRDGR